MKRAKLLVGVFVCAVMLASIPAMAINLQTTMSADCEGYEIVVTGLSWHPYECTISLVADGVLVNETFDVIPAADYSVNVVFSGSWEQEFCGMVTVSGSYEIVSDRTGVPPYNYPGFSGQYDPVMVDCPCDCIGTGTPGYWKNHPEAWPVDAIEIGCFTIPKENAILIMQMSTKNNKLMNVFEHLVAAKLNVIIGNPSECIDESIAALDEWLCSIWPDWSIIPVVEAGGEDSPWRTAETWFEMLAEYNEGELCAPSRDECEDMAAAKPTAGDKPCTTCRKKTEKVAADVPGNFGLAQNTPNPFNPVTTIEFSIPAGSEVQARLDVYDLRGSLVRTLVDGTRSPGVHNVIWNGTDEAGNMVSSGIYIYRLRAADYVMTQKMTLLR